jgi:very-short-patch-repair endonuclease
MGLGRDAGGVEVDGRGVSGYATQVIRELAERQHGVVARRQLLEGGLSIELIRGRLENGRLIPIYEGVFAVGHLRIGRSGRWMAAVLASGPSAVLSHDSAAEIWAMRKARGLPEVTRRSGGTRRAGVRLHQTRVLEPAEVTTEAGIPVTSVERTLLDIAARLDTKRLERALVAADRTGRLRWPELERLLARTPRRPGAGRLRRVALQVDPRAVDAISPQEVDFLALCREAGLTRPEVNVLVEGRLVDFLWPAERVVIETDSYVYHRDRPAFERDHEGTVALTAAGYVVHRATYAMLVRDPDTFLAVVRRSLNSRCASRSSAISTQT